ncbi:MAG: DNA mismatch repair endonuclease MutL [Lachnospiraceae bacterium]|nr:DNA mismatch repair endonuclease MutL [Lachnospiraceae bacterium]
MSVINVLDKNTVNQIAAGEVIERPASVVKELIENSIDAGATAVSCEIKGGGIELIRITDNGCGIGEDDVRTAFLRHATSKIKDASDLADVLSLGFRGEALASIASVSEVELLTRRKDDVTGIRYLISGGEEQGMESVGCPEGTTFIVRNLFGNVPVRRKFLKSASTEGSIINELIEKIAISHPEVSIKFINNSRTVIFTTGSNSIRDIVYGIYGREITASLLEVNYEDENGIKVSGFVAKPVVARSNRNLEHYYVNGRYIRSNIISKAIEQAFAPYLMLHKYPFTALHLEIPAQTMDVNVHPTKQEVRFEKPDDIFNAVYQAVCNTLRATAFIPKTITPPIETRKEVLAKNMSDERVQSTPEPFEKVRAEQRSAAAGDNKPEQRPVTAPDTSEQKPVTVPDMPAQKPVAAGYKTGQEPFLAEDKTVDNGYKTSFVAEDIGYSTDTVDDTVVTGDMSGFARSITQGMNTGNITDSPDNSGNGDNTDSRSAAYAQLVFETDIDRQNADEAPAIRPETKEEFKKGMYDGFKLIGQIFNTYWIVELSDKLYMIDQHAAHEKTIYEKLVKQYNEAAILSQSISPAMIVSLSAQECEIVEKHRDDLARLGFDLESFGGREYRLSSVPLQLYQMDAVDLLHELIDTFSEDSVRLARQTATMNYRLATCACKAAVKGNTRISREEAEALIKELLTLQNPFNCPHGRPVIISMTKYELERKFKRVL